MKLRYFSKIKGRGGHTNEYYDYLSVKFKIFSFDDLVEVLQKLQIKYEVFEKDYEIKQSNNYSFLRIIRDSELPQFAFMNLCNTIVKVVLDNSLISLSIHGKEGFQDGWGDLVNEDYIKASDIENSLENIDIRNRIKKQ